MSSPLQRRDKESEAAHRALLLYAMQFVKKRSMRAVSRAMERSSTTVREYSIRWEWSKRMEEAGANCEVEAQQMYRHVYFPKFGVKEVSAVESNIVTPVSVASTTPRSVTEAVTQAIEKSNENKPTVFDKEMKRKHLMLVDAAIGYVAQGIKNQDIRVTLKDIPLLLNLRGELTGEKTAENRNSVIAESIRVQDAKARGSNLIEAMHDDAVEILSVLESLKPNEEIPPTLATSYSKGE